MKTLAGKPTTNISQKTLESLTKDVPTAPADAPGYTGLDFGQHAFSNCFFLLLVGGLGLAVIVAKAIGVF